MSPLSRFRPLAMILLRVSLGLAFLSAVADRFGMWGPPGTPNVAWGTFASFLEFTGLLLGFLPPALVKVCGWSATVLEVVLGLLLLVGWQLRWVALASAGLLFSFALFMTISLGLEPAFSYSVWTAAAAAFLLACQNESRTGAPYSR